jgi:hypothetical protein
MSRDYISLHAPCRIFVDRPAWLESPISHSINSDVQIHFAYLTSQTVLLLLIFVSLPNILLPLIYGHSGVDNELFQRDNRYALWIMQQ